jgi:hypothetical protein
MSKIRLTPARSFYLTSLLFTCMAMTSCLPASIPTPTPTQTLTPIPTQASTQIPIQTLSPATTLPYSWPVTPLTNEQIDSVKKCHMESLVLQRYPDSVLMIELPAVFTPQSDCDWAALALAYLQRLDYDQSLPQSAKNAFSQAVSRNPGFALATPLFYRYFDSLSLVEPPTFAQHEITDVKIRYQWGGLGDPVYYTAEIHDANSTPVITIRPDTLATSVKATVKKEIIQALTPALTDLIPIRALFSLSPCYDNYPSWEVRLTFTDQTTILMTANSNFIDFGGPWFTWLDGHYYIQLSNAFPKALGHLVSNLHLPPGEPGAMTCGGEEDVFGQAFPLRSLADTGPTVIPPTAIPTPAVTATSLFKLTHVPSSLTTGIFARKSIAAGESYYQILRFYDDGLVIYESLGLSANSKLNWPSEVYSMVYRDSNSVCRGNYYLRGNQIEFSLSCTDPTFWWDETPVPWNIDYAGTYNSRKLVLDSYSHYNGYSATQEVFLSLDDPALKP